LRIGDRERASAQFTGALELVRPRAEARFVEMLLARLGTS
jgi:hypothetical protein